MPLHVQRVQSLDYSSPDNCDVGASSTEVIPANPARKYLIIVNASNEAMYLGIGVAAEQDKGVYLAATGGSFEMITANLSPEIVYGICASGTKNATVQEAT